MKRSTAPRRRGTYAAMLALLPLLGLGLLSSNPGAAFKIEITDHTQSPPKVETTEVVVEGKMLTMTVPSKKRKGGKVIYRGDRGEMLVVDDEHASYMVIDEAMVEEMSRQLGEAREMAKNMQIPEEVLKRMPKEQREKMEKMMKERLGGMPGGMDEMERPRREYRKTDERATMEGYPCVKYEVFVDGERVQEMWVTGWENVEGGEELKAAFEDMAAFFEKIMAALGEEFFGDKGFFGEDNDPFGGFMEVDGFPVVTRDFEGGDLESEAVLRSARRRTVDPAEFEPPSGYKRQSMGPR
ncbi:hypothetical protein [Rhodocaloribacter sp.]